MPSVAFLIIMIVEGEDLSMELEQKARTILLAAGATEAETDVIVEDACHVFEDGAGGKELVDWLIDKLEELRSQGPAVELGEDDRLHPDTIRGD